MFRLVYGIFYLLSLLPFRVLYFLGDIATFFLRDVFGYRKAVVMYNLAKAFPEKSLADRKKIAHAFYRNFTDNWIETIKLLTISKKTLDKRFAADYGPFIDMYKSGRPMVMVAGHFFNWEYLNLQMGVRQPYPFLTVYMPISDRIFDQLFIKLRSRWNNIMVRATDMRTDMLPWRKKQYLLGLLADQSPGGPEGNNWMYFLNEPTAFVRGPERSAKMLDAPVIMTSSYRVKRGYYRIKFEWITQQPLQEPTGAITRKFVRLLEENIAQSPDLYLWSHNRWKLKWNKAYTHLWIDEQVSPAE